MSDEQARFAAWCAEGRGGLAPPSEDARAVLEELRGKGDVDVATIVTKRSSLPKDDAREIWLAVFSEVSAALERAEGRVLCWCSVSACVVEDKQNKGHTQERDCMHFVLSKQAGAHCGRYA